MWIYFCCCSVDLWPFYQAGDTLIPFTTQIAGTTTKNCRLQSWSLNKSADCRWISITILCVSFTNSATVGRLKQVQLCNRRIDQSVENITGLKCAKECLILKYQESLVLHFIGCLDHCSWWYICAINSFTSTLIYIICLRALINLVNVFLWKHWIRLFLI